VRAAEQTETREVDDSRRGIGSVLFCELQNVVRDSWRDVVGGDDRKGRMFSSNAGRLETGLRPERNQPITPSLRSHL
jgi:hypothetical protein